MITGMNKNTRLYTLHGTTLFSGQQHALSESKGHAMPQTTPPSDQILQLTYSLSTPVPIVPKNSTDSLLSSKRKTEAVLAALPPLHHF